MSDQITTFFREAGSGCMANEPAHWVADSGAPLYCRAAGDTQEEAIANLRTRMEQVSVERSRPVVVCLCGSSRWPYAHLAVSMQETLAGRIVIPMGCYGHADFPSGARQATSDGDESDTVKQMLDQLHFRKIDLADEIVVITVDGVIGNSTRREIAYAESLGKAVRYVDGGEFAGTECTLAVPCFVAPRPVP